MSNEEKGKMSLAVASGFTVLGIVLTIAALFIPAVRHLLGSPSRAAVRKHAKIKLLDNSGTSGTCEYKADLGGNDVLNKFPVLSKQNNDDIDWVGKDGRAGHHDQKSLQVNFPNSAAGSPFYPSSTFTSTGTTPVSSGPITTNTYGDFAYASIVFTTDDGQTISCSNATDPGVHVDQ